MDQAGMWKLFFATGLPELYLAVHAQREARGARPSGGESPPAAGELTAAPGGQGTTRPGELL